MIKDDLKKYSLEYIKNLSLPVYIFGIQHENIFRLSRYMTDVDLKPQAIFVYDKTEISEDIEPVISGMGCSVHAVPEDVSSLEYGIVIFAGERIDRRKYLNNFSQGTHHVIYEASDLFAYPSWLKCIERDKNEMLPKRCRSCAASDNPSCPVLSPDPEQGRIISRLLVHCGFLCNKRCDGCVHFIPYFNHLHRPNFDGKLVLEDVEKIASSVSYIKLLWLEGGEAMLWKPFAEFLRKVCKIENIGNISILTNGTYVPNKDVIDAIEENRERITIEISKYEISDKIGELEDVFRNAGITYFVRPENKLWTDFREIQYKECSKDSLNELSRKCIFFKRNMNSFTLTDGYLSCRCNVAEQINFFNNNRNVNTLDYVNIRTILPEQLIEKMDNMFYSDYLETCQYCATPFSGKSLLPVAKQLT